MKKLYLLRHAHATAADLTGNDHARDLTAEGRAEAEALGAFLAMRGIRPALVLSSDSKRTLETARLAGISGVIALPGLYLAHQDDISGLITAADGISDSLMVIGHNPGIAELAMSYSGDKIFAFTPGTLAIFDTAAESWDLLSPENTTLEKIFAP